MISCSVVAGSQVITPAGQTSFARRSAFDVVSSPSLPGDTVVEVRNGDNLLTLSSPFGGATGSADLTFHNDLHNYAVPFFLAVQ